MKAVSERREELRARHHAQFQQQRGSLRPAPVTFMKQTVERLKLSNLLESPDTRDKLAQAGYRGQAPLVAFMFFRFVMPFIVFAVAMFYLFLITHFTWSPLVKFLVAAAAALLGYYLPDLFVSNMIQKRQQSIISFTKVASEIGPQSVELAEELGLTTAELSYLPERRQAFDNLAKRTGHSGVKAACLFVVILGPAIMRVTSTMHH
jgi:tight adherence protein C